MALTFTSNKKATSIISDASGYKGPLDYFFNADIANHVYLIQAGGQKIEGKMEDVFQTGRTSNRGHVFVDEKLGLSEVPANTPRRTYLPAWDTYGILVEEARYNFFDGQNAITALPVNTNTFACYAIGGSAKVSATQVDVISGSGTYEDPQFFKLKTGGTVTPTLAITGTPTSIQVEQLVQKLNASAVPGVYNLTKAAENLSIPAGAVFTGTQGCLVLNILENKPNVVSGASGYAPYFQISLDENNYLAMNRRVERNTLTFRIFKEGSEVLGPQLALSTLNNKIAVSWDNGKITYAVNGISYEVPVLMGATFKANAVRLLSAVSGWVAADGNSALANMITYNRALTKEELQKATVSW